MESPPVQDLIKKILELERSQEYLRQELSRLKASMELRQPSHSVSLKRNIRDGASSPLRRERIIQGSMNCRAGVREGKRSAGKFTDKQYLNILQSTSQSVHALDLNMRVIFWNAMSEKLYGYTAAEVVGQNPVNVIVDDRNAASAMNVARRCVNGETWCGEFPVKTKSGEIFSAVTTACPFYDDNGSVIGIISITSDTAPYLKHRVSLAKSKAQKDETSPIPARNIFASKLGLDAKGAIVSKLGLVSDQPIQVAIASRISDLAFKVRSKMGAGDTSAIFSKVGGGDSHHSDHDVYGASLSDHKDNAALHGASTLRGDFTQYPFGVFTCNDEKCPSKPFKDSNDKSDAKPAVNKALFAKVEEWMVDKGLSLPWKKNEQEGSKRRPTHSVWSRLQNEQENVKSHQTNSSADVKSKSHASKSNKHADNEASSLWSSSTDKNSSSSASSCGSTGRSVMNKLDPDSDCLEYEILWDDLTIGEKIGQGSCGTVYRGVWFGSDVAVKVFYKQEYSEEVIQSFRQEVWLMKRLTHPNVLLFMGAVTSPQRLCIVSELVPRGSLFCLLHRGTLKLDWRRRIHMALDIARGMNYLHRCRPPIVHCDLKSSNLLVDRNLNVKVADFGLSRIKHKTYLTTKSGEGTPQWMAPEVLRNESADEKSDIYSFGIILWELATEKIPWENLNSMQVIGAVGFMDQRLEIPKDSDPTWNELMKSCWHSDTKLRPTFQELMEKLRDLQRKYTLQFRETRAALPDNPLHTDN